MGSVLLVSGTGIRKCTKNCQILLHSASSYNGVSNVHEAKVDFEHLKKMNELTMDIICSRSNFSKEELETLTKFDYWIGAEEALSKGIVDEII